MFFGDTFGKPFGFIYTSGLTPQTASVRIVNGVFLPCKSCHWFSDCVVPKGKYLPKSESFAIRPIYLCEDYTPNPLPQ